MVHFRCLKLSKDEFNLYAKTADKIWRCSYCVIYRSNKCTKVIKHNLNSLCCNVCNTWVHLKCSRLSKVDFETLSQGNKDEPWFCKTCIYESLPFGNLDNKQIKKLWYRVSPVSVKSKIQEYHKSCNICKKRNHLIDKGIPCVSCKSFSHKTCTEIPMKQLESNKHLNYLCITCSRELFPFYDCGYDDIISDSFNSNFDCKCMDKQ